MFDCAAESMFFRILSTLNIEIDLSGNNTWMQR